MKYRYSWSILLIVAIVYQSCETVIDIPLENGETLLVVDAWLNTGLEKQTIKLTYSQEYFENEFSPAVEGALVSITGNAGETITFVEEGNGNYSFSPGLDNSIGIFSDVYTLDISIDGFIYTSEATINNVPQIDSITQEFRENELFFDDGIYLQFFARDLPGVGDTYWIKTFKDDQYLNKPIEINIAFDAAFDSGAPFDNITFIPPIREAIHEVNDSLSFVPWEVGETVKVEIHSISNVAFNFMETTRDQLLNGLNGIFAEPLANTIGNIQSSDGREALGIFNIAKISTLQKVIE